MFLRKEKKESWKGQDLETIWKINSNKCFFLLTKCWRRYKIVMVVMPILVAAARSSSGDVLPVHTPAGPSPEQLQPAPVRWAGPPPRPPTQTLFYQTLKMHVSFCGWIPRCGCWTPCSRHAKNKCKKRERQGNLCRKSRKLTKYL